MAFRDGPFHDLKLPVGWAAVGAALVAIVAALAMLLADHRASAAAPGAFAPVRNGFSRAAAPVGKTLETPVVWVGDAIDYVGGYFFAISENRRLKQQIRDLEGWRDEAIALKNVNDRYEALLKLKTEPDIPMVSARSVMDSRGPFANARLLDVGSEAGVQPGDPAISEHGIVGRIVGVTRGVSRLLLVTDVESRTPVLVDRTNARAILTGDGGPYPRLEYVRGRDPIKDGDMILTSGDGGVFPRGLPVGVAARDLQGVWRVRLYSDQAPIDFVRILLFQDFSQKVSPAALTDSSLPPLTRAEDAQRTAALQKASAPPPASPTSASAAPGPASAAKTRAAKPAKTAKPKTRAGAKAAQPDAP